MLQNTWIWCIIIHLCFLCLNAKITRYTIHLKSDVDNKYNVGVETTDSDINCARLCSKHHNCSSVHFSENSRRCLIYSSNRVQSDATASGVVIVRDIDDCGDTVVTGPVDIFTIGPVYCENEKEGGGWTVFQRRVDGSVDFYRNWEDYKNGFGDMNGEFWLGLEKLHKLTSSGQYMLRVDLQDFDNNTAYAVYSSFRVGNESEGYRLDIGGYSGDAGDSLSTKNDMKFSTKDVDNDLFGASSCADMYKGAWWYTQCHVSNLNGQYLGGTHVTFADGINWFHWKGFYYSLKATEMMVRRL